MSESVYAEIAFEAAEELPPFRFQIDGQKFELPNLRGPNVPVELFATALLFMNTRPDDKNIGPTAKVFVDYLTAEHQGLVRVLNRHPQTMPMLTGLIKQWGGQAAPDPKVSNS